MGVQSAKTKMLATVWALVNIEASSIIEKALNYFGEVALHSVSALGSSFAVSRYYESTQGVNHALNSEVASSNPGASEL